MLHYVLPAGLEMHGATVFFSQFGEVYSLGLVPGDELTLAVMFYDVRSVPMALSALEAELCWPMPKQGCFTAKVPGSWNITPKDMDCIADMRVDPQDESSYLIEFFDRRDAAHMRQAAEAWGLPDSRSKSRPARPVHAFIEVACASNEFMCMHHKASGDEPVYLSPPSSLTGWLAWVPPAEEVPPWVHSATSSCTHRAARAESSKTVPTRPMKPVPVADLQSKECAQIQPRARGLSASSVADESTEAPPSSDAGEEAPEAAEF